MIRVFVGCAANHEDLESQAVLEYSIRSQASEEVQITWMKLSRDPGSPFYSDAGSGWNTSSWATPFSGFRWIVPKLCNYEGRAIYTDSDVIFLDDIAKLWNQPFNPGKIIIGKGGGSWRFCVSMWDCEAAKVFVGPGQLNISQPDFHRHMCRLLAEHPEFVQQFAGDWNCLDGKGYDTIYNPYVKALHYTDMRCQPQLKYAKERLAKEGRKHWFDGHTYEHAHPEIQPLFDRLLREALESGFSLDLYQGDPLYGDYTKRSFR